MDTEPVAIIVPVDMVVVPPRNMPLNPPNPVETLSIVIDGICVKVIPDIAALRRMRKLTTSSCPRSACTNVIEYKNSVKLLAVI